MVDTDTAQVQKVPVDNNSEPVKIDNEDFDSLRSIQTFVDALAKYRQEMGRLVQLQGNMREEANKVEVELSEARTALAKKYNLDKMGSGQWALDFESKEFVKTASGSPVIP